MKKINALQSFGVLLCLQMLTCSLRQCEEKLLWQVRLGRALDLALTVISLGVRSSTLQAEYIFYVVSYVGTSSYEVIWWAWNKNRVN